MDSISSPRRRKFAKIFSKLTHLKKSTKNRLNFEFCIPITPKKLRCYKSKLFDEEAMAELRDRAAMEAFVVKLFAKVPSVKAAYIAQQMAQLPYDDAAVQSVDQAIVDELRAVSELKRQFPKNRIEGDWRDVGMEEFWGFFNDNMILSDYFFFV